MDAESTLYMYGLDLIGWVSPGIIRHRAPCRAKSSYKMAQGT